MPWLPGAVTDLSWERATAAQHLPNVGEVRYPIFTPDGKGGTLVSYADDPDVRLPCRLGQLTQRQRTLMEDIIRNPESTEVLSLPFGTVLPDFTRVSLIGRLGFFVQTYACPHPGDLATLAIALCERTAGQDG